MGIGLLLGVWIARYLGPEQFGLLNFATAFIGLFGVIAGLGLQGIVVRDIVLDHDTARLTLGTAAVLQLVAGMVAYLVILCTIAYLRSDENLARIIVAILGATILFKASELASYWFESQVQSKYTVWVQNSVFLVFATIKVALILSYSSLVAFVLVMLAEAIVTAGILMVVVGYRGLALSSLNVSTKRAKKLLKDSWPLILSSLSVVVYMKIDQIMLGQMIDDTTVGIYSAAVKVAEVWYFVPVSIAASLFPTILNAKKHNEELFLKRFQNLCDALIIFSLTISLPAAYFAEDIVAFMYGEKYNSSSTVLKIYIFGLIFICMAVVGNKWYLANNRLDLAMKRDATGAVINICLNLLLIPNYAAVGAAMATIISFLIAHFVLDYFSLNTRDLFYIKLRAFNLVAAFYRLKGLR
jgi:O-antigen/teichoic acid export membrane protein